MTDINIEEMDESMLQEASDILKTKFPMIVEAYIEDCKQYIENINSGIENKNSDTIAESAHPLKSSSYSFGLMGLGKISEVIEHTAKEMDDSDDIDDIERMLPELNAAFNFAELKLDHYLNGSM